MPTPDDGPSNTHAPRVLDEGVLDQVRGGAGGRTQTGDIIITKDVDKSSPGLLTGGPSKPPPPPPKPAT